jgi:thiamine biosynthesis lipoprotein ApbE
LFGYDQKNKATDFANSLKTMSEQQKNDLAKLNNQNTQQTALAAQQQQYTLTNTAKQVAANTQGMYLDAINGLTSTFGDQVAVINASSMKAEDKKNSINSLISAQNSMLKFYQSTYQNMSTIKDDWVNVDVNTLPTGSIAQLK